MADQYQVIAQVVKQEGTCECEHRVTDEFAVGDLTPAGMCSFAFYAMFPFVSVLQFGGSFPWEKDPGKTTVACPDPADPVVFELRRVPR